MKPTQCPLKAAVERELDRLESAGILQKLHYSEWAAPVVPVPKTEGIIRLGVWIQWNGIMDWNGGMERWTGLVEWNGGLE